MIKRYILPCFSTVLILFWTNSVISYSDGPPAQRIGNLGELSCSSVYCHGPGAPNTAVGEVSIQTNIPPEGYIPNEVYTIKTSVAMNGQKRFGFQLSSIDSVSGISSGEFFQLDTNLVQLVSEEERVYISHKLAKISDDSASWEFNWKAPEDVDEIGLYAAFVAANNDSTRSGDFVYTSNLKLKKASSTGIGDKLLNINHLSLYPSPVQQLLYLKMEVEQSTSIAISIFSLDGKLVYKYVDYVKPGNYEQEIPTELWENGVYLVKIRSNGTRAVHKVMKI